MPPNGDMAQSFPAGKDYEIKSLRRVFPKILLRRRVGGRIVHGGHTARFANFDELFGTDLAVVFRFVEEEHHAGTLIDGGLEFLACFDRYDFRAAQLHLVLVAGAVRLLLDHLVLDAVALRQLAQLRRIALRKAGGGAHGDGGSRAAGDHGGRSLQKLGNSRAHFLFEFGQGDEEARGLLHRADHLGRHDGTAEHGDDADSVDDGFHTQARVEGRGCGSGNALGGGRCGQRRGGSGLHNPAARSFHGSYHMTRLGSRRTRNMIAAYAPPCSVTLRGHAVRPARV
jgi:hypothetical protein